MNQIKEYHSNSSNTKEEKDTVDRIKEILVSIGEELFKFLQRDIDSLELPDIIKKALKTLKTILTFIHAIVNHGQNWRIAQKTL